MKTEKQKTEKKILYIELKKDIQRVLEDYCKEAGIPLDDLGFAMGYITGVMKERASSMEQLMFLLQLYFFSGVYYAKSTKGFKYDYLDKNSRKKEMEKLNQRLQELLGHKEEKPSYMG